MIIPSSERWGGVSYEVGKYPTKIYTIDGVMIYQEENGTTNAGKAPKGGVMFQSSVASSMATTITNPITYYGGAVINQSGHSGDLYNYYWTSYSRGTDGSSTNTKWHNAYLDGYIPLRAKSIYDPCPYLYRIPSNGAYNQFKSNPGWTLGSYLGGVSWNLNTLGESWFITGLREANNGQLLRVGDGGWYWSSIPVGNIDGYQFKFYYNSSYHSNANNYRSYGFSVRCIDFATLY